MFAAKNILLTSGKVPPPSYDNSATSTYQTTVASGTAFTWTQTATGSPYAIVAIYSNDYSGAGSMVNTAASVVSFGGTGLSSLGSIGFDNNPGLAGWVWVFGGPVSAGASQTVSVKLTQAGDTFTGYGASYTYNGVISVGSLKSGYGTSTAPTLAVPSAVNHLVWASIGEIQTVGAPTFTGWGLASRQTQGTTGTLIGYIGGDAAGAATVTAASSSSCPYWAVVGLDLI